MKARPRAQAMGPRAPPDLVLLCAVLGLTALGVVMVYSASAITAEAKLHDQFYFLKRQLAGVGLGITLLAVAMKLGYRRLEPLAWPILGVTLAALVAVLVPGIGHAAGGARRWIPLGFFSFQPAEAAKIALVLYLARSLAKKRDKVKVFTIGFLPHCIVAGLMIFLCLLEPDFGTSVVLALLLFALLFAAGARMGWLVGSLLVALPVAYQLVAGSPYRMRRITAFLDPWAHRDTIGYQIAESLMSVGSGGWFGQGLGDGKEKLFYLPAAHTDFIAAVVAEELGLVGILALVALYGIVIWRGLRAAYNAGDAFGCYLALGLSALIGIQAAVNLSVVFGLLPTKGLTLPFLSYGGSSVMVLLAASGVLLSVSASRGGFLRSVMKGASQSPEKEVAR
jgi:cell division protein FtsW